MSKRNSQQTGFCFGDFDTMFADQAAEFFNSPAPIETTPEEVKPISNWKEAGDAVKEFAAQYGVTAIYWGTGNPIAKPHAVASTLDAWSGEGMGYFVRVYPEGDHGYMSKAPCHMTTIRIGK